MGLFCNHKELNEEINSLKNQIGNMKIAMKELSDEKARLKFDNRNYEWTKERNQELETRVDLAERNSRYLEGCFDKITKANEAMKNV